MLQLGSTATAGPQNMISVLYDTLHRSGLTPTATTASLRIDGRDYL